MNQLLVGLSPTVGHYISALGGCSSGFVDESMESSSPVDSCNTAGVKQVQWTVCMSAFTGLAPFIQIKNVEALGLSSR